MTPAARAVAFDRVSLAVRRSIMLWRHLAEAKPIAPEIKRAQSREHVIRHVQDRIERRADPAAAEHLRLELLERLDSPDFEHDLLSCPPGQLVEQLSRDLGLMNLGSRPDHCRRTPAAVALLRSQAAAPAAAGLARWAASQPPTPIPK